ncbi:kinase-like domain-containing protein [Mycena floridula]|nr:kinase-like domain-containing protein [Mycena floridula]
MIRLDALTTCAQISALIENKDVYQSFLSEKGDTAKSLLNLLHQLVDWDDLPGRVRAKFTDALIRLSQKSELYPDLLSLTGLQTTGSHAIAAGGASDIWRGVLRGQNVSVKVARVFSNNEKQTFVKVSDSWSQLSHPNVLPLYGIYYIIPSRLCMVSPWMENGNIVDFLKTVPSGSVNRYALLSDVANGIEYLHNQSIIHGDLKGLNILITRSRRACLMDFGFSSIANSNMPTWSSSSAQRGGTARWQAPEILEGGRNTFKGDIYAYGCVCYEIFAGRIPFHNIPHDSGVLFQVISGIRPNRPMSLEFDLDDAVWNLMKECWLKEPAQRPTAAEVVQVLLTRDKDLRSPPVQEWNTSFARDLRRSLRQWQLVPSIQELETLLKDQGWLLLNAF